MYQSGENLGDGIRVTEQAMPSAVLEPAVPGVVAFVGRTLRGPVNSPVVVRSFSEFERVFGGLWQPSPLAYSLSQFFGNGGREAVVVRVANAARSATVLLPSGSSSPAAPALAEGWRLAARQPGTRDFLRAAVDYDGLDPDETDEFNLLLQRVRTAGSEVVEVQEYYARASAAPGNPRFLSSLLESSALVACQQAAAGTRPLATPPRQWLLSGPDGHDGLPPTDHDLIGSREARTGLFALAESAFQWLVIPPRDRELAVGIATWVVAARFCAERQATLLVDPPAEWLTPEQALAGLSSWALRVPAAAMWFPWVKALDPLRGELARFAPSGAVAGLLSRHESQHAPWRETSLLQPLPPLRPGYGLAAAVSAAARLRLGALGVNVPSTVRVPRGYCPPQVTLAAAVVRSPYSSQLLWHRRLQTLGEALLRGTRWVLFFAEPAGNPLWRQVARQVSDSLARSTGREAGPGAGWFVVCDRRLNPADGPTRALQFLFGLADPASGEWQAFLVRHTPAGSDLRPVSPNAWALPPRQWADAEGRRSPPASVATRQMAGESPDVPAVAMPSR